MPSGYQTEAERQKLAQRAKLVIKVVEARGVKAADWGGTSDPYCELRMKNSVQCVKTKTIKKTLNPYWNEEFTLPVDDQDKDILVVRVYDYDAVSRNDLLGEFEIPIIALVAKPQAGEQWRQLMKKKGPTTWKPAKGELRLGITYVPAGGQAPAAAAPAAAAPAAAPAAPVAAPAAAAYPPQYPPQYPPAQPQYPQYPPQYPPAQPQYPGYAQPQYPQYPPAQPQYPQYPPQQYGAAPPAQYPPQQYGAPQYPPPGY